MVELSLIQPGDAAADRQDQPRLGAGLRGEAAGDPHALAAAARGPGPRQSRAAAFVRSSSIHGIHRQTDNPRFSIPRAGC